MNWLDIFCGYFAFSFLMYMMFMAFLETSDYKHGDWRSMFALQYELYEIMKDKLNIYGIIILEILITILTFGASALVFATGSIVLLSMSIWKLFCFCFKKR